MIIQCPYCNTRFQLDDSRLSAPNPMLKCSRCRHIFPGPNAASKKPPAPKPASSPPENLSFTFSEASPSEPLPPAADLTIDEPEPEFELGTEPAAPMTARERRSPPAQRHALEEPDVTPTRDVVEPVRAIFEADEEAPYEPPPLAPTAADDFDDEFRDEAIAQEEEPSPAPGISVQPVLIFLALVVAAYGALAWTLRSNPELADSLFRKLPFISAITEDRLLNRKIVLSDVIGGYQRIKDGQAVFVITGRALNNAPVTVRNIQVVGRLFNNANTQLDEKTIFCGNVVSTKILKSLTQREVSILQDLKPPKRFGIAPGEESTFVIVFMQPPAGVTEFSSQVLAAQRQA
ncbi:MAG: zinc-ribbon domain-containing protein [Deltaproteobacteria bacterium]|nr:zinc-ribbon domain-containing protein [Deltaproteobacteria bacterium]